MNSLREISAFAFYAKKPNKTSSQVSNDKKSKPDNKLKTGKIKKSELKKKNKSKIEKLPAKSVENVKYVNKSTVQSSLKKKKKPNKKKNGVLQNGAKTNGNIQGAEVIANVNEIEHRRNGLPSSSGSTESFSSPVTQSEKLFEWLIYPLNKDDFFEKNWEKTPIHIKRNKSKYYRSLMSTPLLDRILRDNQVMFTTNIDITSYTDGVRETHNPPGRALPSIVWDYFANGCSVRMLNPQTFISKLHALNATLQEFFGCFVGANSYLTPPNSQGFAPHYDDIEAFILQIEGKKRWRLYKPRTNNEFLSRHSSPNFSEKDIGDPILTTVVNPGDLLYFPRGTIHQGDTFGFDEHSLHITLSVYQRNSWGDFLEKLVPIALKEAIKNEVSFRRGMPLQYSMQLGSAFSDCKNRPEHHEILDKTKSLLKVLLMKYVDIDKAADEMAKNHIHDFLPPVLDKNESLCSVYEGAERMIEDGIIANRVEIEPDTFVRLTRIHCSRLVQEEESYRLYYSSDNSKQYHEFEPQFLEVDPEFVPAIKELFVRFPQYVKVEDLPIPELDKKIQLIRDLWEKAIVISKEPLPILED